MKDNYEIASYIAKPWKLGAYNKYMTQVQCQGKFPMINPKPEG